MTWQNADHVWIIASLNLIKIRAARTVLAAKVREIRGCQVRSTRSRFNNMPEQTTIQQFHDAPAWLTREYVEQKLRDYLKDEKVQLERLHIKPATANGENYASVMTRINLEYTDKNLLQQTSTFLVKTTFASKDPAADILEPYGIYVREMNMYEEVLPKLTKILREEFMDPLKYFAATMNVDRERDSIIFEDMSLEKYYVADRLAMLDVEKTKLVLKKLAAFHAAGAVLNEREPGIFAEKYDRCFFNKHTRGYQPVMQNMVRALAKSLDNETGLKQRYEEKLKRLADHIMEYTERAMEYQEGDFLTLCHGDIWTTNMMFHDNEHGETDNVIFIDFQFSVFNSPTIDLQYLFATSIQDNVCEVEMVQFYHKHLVDALKKLKFKGRIPSLFDFQLQFQARAFYLIFSTFAFLPCMVKTGSEEFSIKRAASSAKEDDAVRISLFKTDIMRKRIKKVLPIYDRKGLLDEI